MKAFSDAVAGGDIEAAISLLDDNVEFRSPAVHKPYQGKAACAMILRAVVEVFEDFHYVREIGDEGASDQALVFTARVGDKELEGCDFLHVNEDGLIDEFAVMVRPLSATVALVEAMKVKLAEMARS